MKRPGGDPIFTIEIKRAAGFQWKPRIRDRPQPVKKSWSYGLWWLHTWVGFTYYQFDYDYYKEHPDGR